MRQRFNLIASLSAVVWLAAITASATGTLATDAAGASDTPTQTDAARSAPAQPPPQAPQAPTQPSPQAPPSVAVSALPAGYAGATRACCVTRRRAPRSRARLTARCTIRALLRRRSGARAATGRDRRMSTTMPRAISSGFRRCRPHARARRACRVTTAARTPAGRAACTSRGTCRAPRATASTSRNPPQASW